MSIYTVDCEDVNLWNGRYCLVWDVATVLVPGLVFGLLASGTFQLGFRIRSWWSDSFSVCLVGSTFWWVFCVLCILLVVGVFLHANWWYWWRWWCLGAIAVQSNGVHVQQDACAHLGSPWGNLHPWWYLVKTRVLSYFCSYWLEI